MISNNLTHGKFIIINSRLIHNKSSSKDDYDDQEHVMHSKSDNRSHDY